MRLHKRDDKKYFIPQYNEVSLKDSLLGKSVYIAGPIQGVEDGNRKAFSDAYTLLKSVGAHPFNPHIYSVSEDYYNSNKAAIWTRYTKYICSEADAIVMLDGWEWSRGACLEYDLACMIGLDVYVLEEVDG